MKTYYLAVDIGASSGRHILSHIENGKLVLEEIYRFENNLVADETGLVWDIDSLFAEVLCGIKKCKEIGKIPKSIAIDTWGVDYVLIDENRKEIKPCYCYRDSRTSTVIDEVESLVSPTELYAKTGIQKQNFNTIYQLYADKKNNRLKNAKYFLMMPEYLSFKLTGVCKNEYTNATTTGLVNANIVVFPDGVGVLPWMLCGTNEIGEATAEKMKEFRLVIWGMHGIYGAGKTMDETFGLIETVEKAAQIYMLTCNMPRVNTIKDSEMQQLAECFGVDYRKDFLNL